MKSIIFIIALALLLGGCSSTSKMYSGPDRGAGETAIVQCGDISINIVSCDNKRVNSRAISILPGEHIIEMSYSSNTGSSRDTAFRKFTALAGHTYSVDKIITGIHYDAFIIDNITKERVSSYYLPVSQTTDRLAYIEGMVKQLPRNSDYWYEKGTLLNTLGRYEEALASFNTAISLKPDMGASYWNNKAYTLERLERYEEALTAIETAMKLRGNESDKRGLDKIKKLVDERKITSSK